MKIIKVLLMLCLVYPPTSNAEEWITEEVLKQLSEIRQELKVLQDEVRGMKDQLAQKPQAKLSAGGGTVNIDEAPFVGNKDAEVAIIEFSDYQCPYCRRHFEQTLPEITKSYIDTGKVKYVMKQFPLGFHAKARGASIAALCVEKLKPGKYWKAHESIFSGETKFDDQSYFAFAVSLGIDEDSYKSCLTDSKIAARVDADMREGESIGVSGTPAFFIGQIKDGNVVSGQLITGARPFTSFSNVLDALF